MANLGRIQIGLPERPARLQTVCWTARSNRRCTLLLLKPARLGYIQGLSLARRHLKQSSGRNITTRANTIVLTNITLRDVLVLIFANLKDTSEDTRYVLKG